MSIKKQTLLPIIASVSLFTANIALAKDQVVTPKAIDFMTNTGSIIHPGLSSRLCRYEPIKNTVFNFVCYAPHSKKVIASWKGYNSDLAAQLYLLILASEQKPATKVKALDFSNVHIWKHKDGITDTFTMRYVNDHGKAVINTIFGRYRESYAHKYPGIVFKNFGLLKYGEAQ